MAYTAPSTQPSGTLITSTMYNAHIINNIKFLHGPPTVRVQRPASQTITANQWTAVSFSSKVWDTNAMFATTGTKVTAKTAGKFFVSFNCTFKNSTKGTIRAVGIRKNSTGTGNPLEGNVVAPKVNSVSFNTGVYVAGLVSLTTGQFIEGVLFSDGSSNAVQTSTGLNQPFMSMLWVSS